VFSAAGVRPDEHVEHLADRPFAGDGVAEWEMRLDPVAVAPPGLLLDQVPGIDEIVHDAMCPPLGDVDLDSDVAETYAGVVGDAEQGACAWLVRKLQLAMAELYNNSGNTLHAYWFRCSVRVDAGAGHLRWSSLRRRKGLPWRPSS
jgi:hypothetical protein